MKELIKKFNLTYSDLFLAIGFLFSSVFYAFAWQFMVTSDPTQVFLKPWMIIVSFSITTICWGIYLYLEYRKGNFPNKIVTGIFIFIALIGLITVLVQPSHFERDVIMRISNDMNQEMYPGYNVGDAVRVSLDISPTHRMFFSMGSLVINTIFFIIYFIFPKRFKTTNFIIVAAITVLIFLAIMIGYSYVTEWYKYIPFLKALFGQGTIQDVYDNAVCSFIVHRVPYGVCMMMGLVFAINCHAITEKWYWYPVMAFLYINMIFSYCKSALLISALLIIVYVAFRLYKTYNEHKKRNKILIITFSSIFGLAIVLTAISYLTEGKFIPTLYKMVLSITESNTINTRSFIWDNTFQLLQDGWWVIGRGFGTYNEMLFPMNIVNGDDVCPSHSTYNAVLGAGGIIQLLGFLTILIYFGYLFIKCFKKDKQHTLSLSFGALAFILYSFTEGVNYLICVFIFPIFVLHHTLYNQKENKE